jgi:hypothetical protein
MIDSTAERAIAMRSKDGFIVDESIEMIVDIVADHDLFALGADLGCERIVWEKMLKTPSTIIPVFGVGAHTTSSVLT